MYAYYSFHQIRICTVRAGACWTTRRERNISTHTQSLKLNLKGVAQQTCIVVRDYISRTGVNGTNPNNAEGMWSYTDVRNRYSFVILDVKDIKIFFSSSKDPSGDFTTKFASK